jgi:predicted ATPase
VLRRLKVQNYKSLESVDVKLRPLSVFVGPNNAGKSNIFDCLQFVADLVTQGAGAVHGRGGFGTLVWGGDLKRTISIGLEGVLTLGSGDRIPYIYELSLAGGPLHHSIIKEALSVKRDHMTQKVLEFPSPEQPGVARVWDEEGLPLPIVGYQDFYPLLTNVFQGHFFPGHSLLAALAKTIGSWRSYHFVPARMRQPLPLRKDLQLQSDGGNLPTVLLSLQAEHRDLFRQIVEILRSGVPELRELYAAFTGEGAAYISIEEQGFSQRIPAWAMSDGTLQLLAHLAVLYSPSPPALVCFEEPENFLHPHLLQLVADLFREASKRTQILVSTHSPYLLNFIDPDDLFIVEKSEGKTKVKPAHKKQDLKEALRVLGLGEMWYAGSLGGVPQ